MGRQTYVLHNWPYLALQGVVTASANAVPETQNGCKSEVSKELQVLHPFVGITTIHKSRTKVVPQALTIFRPGSVSESKWSEIPHDLLYKVLHNLPGSSGPENLVILRRICKYWRDAFQNLPASVTLHSKHLEYFQQLE